MDISIYKCSTDGNTEVSMDVWKDVQTDGQTEIPNPDISAP